MDEWSEGEFEVCSDAGKRLVRGLISGPFGIHLDERSEPPGWVVAVIETGETLVGELPFESVEMAKAFVAEAASLADMSDLDPEFLAELAELADELEEIDDEQTAGELLADLMQGLPYIGDDAFRAFLDRHGCPIGLDVIRMRFLGAAVSPGRKADVYLLVEDLFDLEMPALQGPELVAFLQTFMGLFQEVEEASRQAPFALPPIGPVDSLEGLRAALEGRADSLLFGFLEGIWGEDDALPLSEGQAALLTAIEEAARDYQDLRLASAEGGAAGAAEVTADPLGRVAEIDRVVETKIAALFEALRSESAADRPLLKRAMALVDDLDLAEALPREAIRACVARGEEMLPIFLGILGDDRNRRYAALQREKLLFLVIHILGEIGDRRAFSPVMAFLAGDPERVEAALGDAITETLAGVLISLFDGDKACLYRLMNDPSADCFVRSAAFDAWTYLVAAGRIGREEAERYLSSGLEALQPREADFVWAAWLEAIARLGFVGLTDKVREAFKRGLISPGDISFRDFERILEAALQADDSLAFLEEEEGLAPFSDTVGTLSDWYGFSEEYLRRKREAQQPLPPPLPIEPVHTVTNPYRKVGRNDPCPCGSGKKFKKCCLR